MRDLYLEISCRKETEELTIKQKSERREKDLQYFTSCVTENDGDARYI